MLHHLDKSKFPDKFKPMKVKFIEKRPKQTNGYDCGVYVCKYMDAILNGISLHEAEWGTTLTALTFRYRIAWELLSGEARKISEYGKLQRNKGL